MLCNSTFERSLRPLPAVAFGSACCAHTTPCLLGAHDTAHPIAVLSTAGRLKGEAVKASTEASLGDMRKIQALAATYALTGEAGYATKAGDYLGRWAAVNRPTGQPIDETGLEPAIFACRIVRKALPDDTRDAVDDWMLRIALAEIASCDTKRKTATNNCHSHRLKTVGLIGAALDEDASEIFLTPLFPELKRRSNCLSASPRKPQLLA